jgi:hypothetical protein
VRVSDRAKLGVAGGWPALVIALLVAGCSFTIDGRPIASPGVGATEPSFPTPRPSVSPPATSVPSTPAAPLTPGAIPLPPNDDGYVFIETKSGNTRCQISSQSVGCEAEFTNSPIKSGEHANGISITSGGAVEWVLGNLGAIPAVTIDYRTYDAQGWTIAAGVDGTRFTNNRTRHGMFVSIDNVETF